jgi:hypothetical protein
MAGFNPNKLAKVMGSGILTVFGPQIFEGMFAEWIKTVKVPIVILWVEEKRTLWQQIPPEWQARAKHYCSRMDLSFCTVEWACKIAMVNNPGLASLFINWPEALEWFGTNLEDLKDEIAGTRVHPSH